jgi:hypothetical protein
MAQSPSSQKDDVAVLVMENKKSWGPSEKEKAADVSLKPLPGLPVSVTFAVAEGKEERPPTAVKKEKEEHGERAKADMLLPCPYFAKHPRQYRHTTCSRDYDLPDLR